ncbi:hypothetical protein [Glutamicibacter sp. FBE19]|uniref:phage tail tube protein n=1 Tax=Glutamicibacter sp. FBE19 TaxID=2761534 RepID=UPI001896A174|nr:hypothetical protein [Glutamicibacter sp. FBE19]MBF6671598.1 hypothetical protein [Glutamicibacter sp. FBE19]
MAVKMLTDANRHSVFVTDLADYHAPKVSELTGVGAIVLSCNVTAANYQLGSTGDDAINDPALCASSNSTVPGRTNYEASMDFYRWKETVDDIPWATFSDKGIHGYIVSRIGQHPDGTKAHEHPFTAGDEVQVYEVITGTPQIMSPADAGYEKFKMNFSVQDNVDERAVVSATV